MNKTVKALGLTLILSLVVTSNTTFGMQGFSKNIGANAPKAQQNWLLKSITSGSAEAVKYLKTLCDNGYGWAKDVADKALTWAKNNPKTAIAGTIIAILTPIVVHQAVKRVVNRNNPPSIEECNAHVLAPEDAQKLAKNIEALEEICKNVVVIETNCLDGSELEYGIKKENPFEYLVEEQAKLNKKSKKEEKQGSEAMDNVSAKETIVKEKEIVIPAPTCTTCQSVKNCTTCSNNKGGTINRAGTRRQGKKYY